MDYSKAKQTAMRMISKNGMTYQVVRGGGVEIVNGIEQTKEDETFEIKGVRFSYGPRQTQYPSELTSSLIQAGDVKLMCTADSEIKVGDFVIMNGQKWRVVSPNPFQPADIVIYYELQLRC